MRRHDLGSHSLWIERDVPEESCGDFRRIAAAAVSANPSIGMFVPSCYTIGTKRMSPALQTSLHPGSGRGLPIPLGMAAFRKGAVDEESCLVADDRASMLRLAASLAKNGVVADRASLDTMEVPAGRLGGLRGSACWRCEVDRQEGAIKHHNSLYLAGHAAASDDFHFDSLDRFRPLLVSGNLSWGTKAVFDGYLGALRLLGVEATTFQYDEHIRMFSTEVTRKILLGEIANRSLGFTHLIFTDGLSIPPWLLQSTDLPKIVVSTEDPHALDVTRVVYPYYDHVFTNDLNVAELLGMAYLPVAADHLLIGQLPRPVPVEWRSDVLFVGAVYPNRIPWLEKALAACSRLGARLRVIGPATAGRPTGSLAEVWEERLVTTRESLLLHAGAKVCLNFFRDAADQSIGRNREFMASGTSMNPRCYDAPACGSSLLTDFRPEVKAILGEDCIVDEGSLDGAIEKNLENERYRKEKASSEANIVLGGHLYVHRALVLLASIGQGFFRRREK